MSFVPILILFLEEAGLEMFIPGDVILMLVGYHVHQGKISFWLAFVLLFTVVMLGTSILYFLSERYGEKLLLHLGRFIHIGEKEIHSIEKIFRKYGFWVIIVARHIPGLRIPTVFFSGVSEVTFKQFFLCSAISTVPWVWFYLKIGERVGPRAIHLFESNHKFTLLMILPVMVVMLVYYLLKKKAKGD